MKRRVWHSYLTLIAATITVEMIIEMAVCGTTEMIAKFKIQKPLNARVYGNVTLLVWPGKYSGIEKPFAIDTDLKIPPTVAVTT